ncbi:unnamed protein product, partial [Polarella glacialis]
MAQEPRAAQPGTCRTLRVAAAAVTAVALRGGSQASVTLTAWLNGPQGLSRATSRHAEEVQGWSRSKRRQEAPSWPAPLSARGFLSGPSSSSSTVAFKESSEQLGGDWPSKAGRKEANKTLWGSSQPLPYLLRGHVGKCLSGVVREITDDGAVVQLLWEVAAPVSGVSSWQPPPELSPMQGFLDAQALRAAFRRKSRRK